MMNDAPMHSDELMARSKPLVLSENPSEEEEEEYDPRKCGSSIKAYAEEEEEAAAEAPARPIASALVIDIFRARKKKKTLVLKNSPHF